MLVRYDETGRINMLLSDPFEQKGIDKFLAEYPGKSIHVKGIRLPEMPLFDASGNPVLGPDGKQMIDSPGTDMPLVDMNTHYVIKGKIAVRPVPDIPSGQTVEIVADNKDYFELAGLRKPTDITINGEAYTIDDGELHFTTPDAGAFFIQLAFPYVEWFIKVVAK